MPTQTIFPVGARVYMDGRYEVRVKQAFPEGSTSLMSPHYVVDVIDGDTDVKVSMSRIGVVKKTERPRADVRLTEEEFRTHCDAYDGVCLGCGEWTCGGCEPDARKYKCEACSEMRVYGAEETLLMGRINFTEEA